MGKLHFDLVLLDPPYGKGFVPKVISELIRLEMLNQAAIVVVEERSDVILEENYQWLKRIKMVNYGLTTLHIYRWEEDS